MWSQSEASDTRIGYVLKMYPRLSETFIVDEIRALEETGAQVSIISLRFPDDGRFHGDLAQVKAVASYLPSFGSNATLEAMETLSRLGIADTALRPALEFLSLLPDGRRAPLLIQALHLAEQVAVQRFTSLHAHFMTVAAHTAYLAHLFTGVPFTVTAHAKDIFRHDVDREVFRRIGAAARAIVTVCDVNKTYIEDHLADERTRVERIYNGVLIDEGPPTKGRQQDLLLAVGRLVEKKGFHDLVQSCALLRDQGREFRCVIVGDGDQRPDLLRLIADHDLGGRVELAGPLTRHEVAELMRTARVMVAPCIEGSDGNRDALPTVLLEALAHGLPVVSTRLGGIPEILDGGACGLLVPPGDVEALAAATRRLLEDDDLWAAFHWQGRERVEEVFDRRATARELLALFDAQPVAGAAR